MDTRCQYSGRSPAKDHEQGCQEQEFQGTEEGNHVLVISGQPGMGKTTIARMLALDFLSIDCWEGFYWVSSLEEIENEWDDFGQKQVFILDDYWGAVFHRERGRKENYLLEQLIDKFRASDNKWLIITAREYIVQQELFLNPELEDIIKNLKMECVLKEYSDAEKAEILFAHLKASDLDIEYVRSIYYNCDYLVYSRGYSPRVIDKFLKQPGYEAYSPWEYAQELIEWIKYPELIWKGVFAELSEEAKMLSAIVAISYTPISSEDIRNTYSRYVQLYKGTSVPKSFASCISELEETVLLTSYDVEEDKVIVEFENPSIVDFLQGYLWENQEYYIPRLAKCSTFYNQLLMLLEHFHCHDEKINQMIEKRCVEEFYKLPMKLEDYGDSNLGESIYYCGSDWAGRAFHLMRLSQGGPEGVVWDFIRKFVNEFWRQIETNTLFDGIAEMANFVGLIRVCEEKGMHFDGRKVIEQYWNHCFLYNDYESVDSLIKVYPKCSAEWREKYTTFMKKHVKGLILKTLFYYDDYGFDFEEDMLVEEVPSILKTFGLYYTKKFKSEIEDITGRYFEEPKHTRMQISQHESHLSREEMDYEQTKEEWYEKLIELPEPYSNEDLIEIIKRNGFTKENEDFLLQTMETREPWYLYEFMVDESSIELLKRLEDKVVLKTVGRNLDLFAMGIFDVMTDRRIGLYANLIHFCIDYTIELLYKERPILPETKFRKLSCYKENVEHQPELETLLFTYLLERQGKWIVIKQELFLLYLLCHEMKADEGIDWDIVFEKGCGKCLLKTQKGNKAFYFPDFVNPSNMEWIQRIQCIMDEIDRTGFRQKYVVPKLEEFLNQYPSKAERAAAFLEDIRWELDIDLDGEICGGSYFEKDAMILADNLGIAYLTDAEEYLAESSRRSLIERQGICTKKEDYIAVSLYKETDEDYLRKIGVYEALEYYFGKLETFVQLNKE
ncbi:ATP-binding protein [Faecalicatena sp.]|uniref:ATP-binding protein n=1 Tax=Faecalicatena sp. TaxID=2005360 RepID=UPI00259044EE|nr:ATP-binding protein [Faecalicatena sp.]MDY5618729.1 ATP-binding protein [Lachnospiraceae bacterium]